MKIQVTGAKVDLADELEEAFLEPAKQGVREAAEHFRDVTQRLLRKRKAPPAAAPGEAPAMRMGDLARSIKVLPVRVRGRVVSSGIRSDDPGAARLERGFTDSRGIRTFPHPFLAPAAVEAEPGITAILERLIP